MATRTILLRQGGARDVAGVDALMGASFDPRYGEAWTRNQTMGVLAMPGVRLTLAELDEVPVGFTLVRLVLDEAELLLLAVAPPARRHGVGAALLRGVLADCAGSDVAKLHLEVRAGNDAVRLYARHGFAKVGERRNYYRGNAGQAFDAHSYARPIG